MIVSILTIVLILAYAFIAFLPHFHECVEVDCFGCAMIKLSGNMLIGIALSATFYQLTKISVALLDTCSDIFSVRDGTPVGRKVKLSD